MVQRKNWADYPVYLAVRILVCVVQALSLETCVAFSRLLATLACDVIKLRRSVIEENLSLAFPELTAEERQEMTWQMWEHLFLLLTEIAHAPRKIHDTNWRDYFTLHNPAELVRALVSDRPTVVVAGHYGNFELSGFALGILGLPSFTIARTLDNPYLDRFINKFRGAKGQFILPKNGSAHRIDALLASGGTLVFLADQHAGPKGCWVNFFGRPASTHKAIALFSLTNDAPLVVCFARRLGQPLHMSLGMEDMADPRNHHAASGVPALTQWYTSCLERVIRREPRQYWWVHRRWKDTRAKSAPRSQAA